MSNNRLYHRQCFRRHERARSVIVDDLTSQSDDDAVNMLRDVTPNGECTEKAPSPFTAAPSAVSKINGTSPLTSSSMCVPAPESLPSSAAVTQEQISVKMSVNQEENALNKTAVKSISEVNNAAAASGDVDVLQKETSTTAPQQSDLSVLHGDEEVAGKPSDVAVNGTGMLTSEVTSVTVSISADELVLSSLHSVGVTKSLMESTVSDESEESKQWQNKVGLETVGLETTKKTLPEKLEKTESPAVPASVSESSLSSYGVVSAAAEHVAESAAKDEVIPRRPPVSPSSRRHAPVDTGVTTQQLPTVHSPSVDVCPVVSPQTVKLPSGTASTSAANISSTVPVSVCASVSTSSSESSCTTVHSVVKDSHRITPRRPAPLPPTQMQEKVSNQQHSPVAQTAVSTASELPRHSMAADQQVSGGRGLQSDAHTEQQSSKEAVNKKCEEQTAVVADYTHPVPSPRRHQIPKIEVLSADVEMRSSRLSSTEVPETVKAASDSETVAVKTSPVPKPRKSLTTVLEPNEMADKQKPDLVVKHKDSELSQIDRSLGAKSKVGNSLVTDSCMSAAAGEESAKITPTAPPQSPDVDSVPVSCEGNKSPSLSPSLPVKLPRSRKHRAAPQPPTAVSPKRQSPEPEAGSGSTAKPEPQVLRPPRRPTAAAGTSSQVTNRGGGQSPGLPASTSSQVTNENAERSPTVNSEQSSAGNSEPVRRKITPGMKFTFEKDVFRPPQTTVDASEPEQLKPSRRAPPRPPATAISKRKVLWVASCLLYSTVKSQVYRKMVAGWLKRYSK